MQRYSSGLSFLVFIVLLSLPCYGDESESPRIINGKPVSITKEPYMVSLRIKNAFACGGTLLSRQFVVTAAHCVYGVKPSNIVVVGGTMRLSRRGIRRRVSKVIIPKGFKLIKLNNDVAVLKLSKKMTGPRAVGTKLCNQSWKAGKLVRVSGWGIVNKNTDALPDRLQTIVVPIISKKKCEERYQGVAKLTKSMICAGIRKGRGSCSGDSGGALMYKGRLCGIVSWGVGCAESGFPGVYTSIKKVRNFIRQAMKNN